MIEQRYVNGGTSEIPESMILQMMGRAGRQQYFSSGRVVIMTKQQNVVNIKFFPDLKEFNKVQH